MLGQGGETRQERAAHTPTPQLFGKARMYKFFKVQINTWKVMICDPLLCRKGLFQGQIFLWESPARLPKELSHMR